MATPRERFQALLRELFQLDSADLDLDVGICRVMKHKRALIEQCIEKDLPHRRRRRTPPPPRNRQMGYAEPQALTKPLEIIDNETESEDNTNANN